MKRLFQQAVAKYRLYASAPQLQAKVAELEGRLSVSRDANAELLAAGICLQRRVNAAESLVCAVRAVIDTTPEIVTTGSRKEGGCK